MMFENVISVIVILSVISLFLAIYLDFYLYNKKDNVKQGKKSIVATGSMVGFYLIYYLILRLKIGTISINKDVFYYTIVIIGTIMILFGCIINILGRVKLKNNWANHIKIYDNHKLITEGAYKIVRHPLYASIMIMLLGGSLVYRNYISAIITVFVFIPFMYYRAKQEEKLLSNEFIEYKEYMKKTGMFFPKLWR